MSFKQRFLPQSFCHQSLLLCWTCWS